MKILFILASLFSVMSCSYIKRHLSTKNEKRDVQNYVMGPTQIGKSPLFVDKTYEYGLSDVSAVHIYSVDLNADQATDLVVLPDYFSIPEFYLFNKKSKKFEKIDFPFDQTLRASYLQFADVNKDNIQDVLVGVLNQNTALNNIPVKIYYGKLTKGKLSYQLKHTLGDNSSTATASFVDINLDGHLDVFLGNWFGYDPDVSKSAPDRLWLYQDGSYVDSSALLQGEYHRDELLGYVNAKPTFSSSICDIDQNGFPDILTGSSAGHANKLWMNLYDRKYDSRILRDYAKSAGYASDQNGEQEILGGGNTFTTNCADYNNDGIMDVFVGEMSHSFDNDKKDRSSILTGASLSFPPKFYRTDYIYGPDDSKGSQADRRAFWKDINGDSLLDLVVVNSGFPPHTRLIYFEQNSDHSFVNKAREYSLDVLNPSGAVSLDLNQDGRLDMIVGQSSLRMSGRKVKLYVFENQIPKKKRQDVQVYLHAKNANADAFGAMLILKTDKREYRRFYNPSGGSLPSQEEKGAYFSLTENEHPLKMFVRFPYSKNQRDNSYLKRVYNLSSLWPKQHVFTLCEDGRILKGRAFCYR